MCRGQTPAPTKLGDYRAKWAVIVGIGDYPASSGLGRLMRPPKETARAVHEMLAREFGFPSKELASEDHILSIYERKGTKQAVEDAFAKWLPGKSPGPNDAVVVYLTGHGYVVPTNSGPEGYFVAADSTVTDPKDLRPGVSMSFIRGELAKLPCLHKLVILDCCYSGLLLHGADPPAGQKPPSSAPAAQVPIRSLIIAAGRPSSASPPAESNW